MLTMSGAVDTGDNGCDVTAAVGTAAVDCVMADGATAAAKDAVLSRCNGLSAISNDPAWLARSTLRGDASPVDFGGAAVIVPSDPLGAINAGAVVAGRAVGADVDEPSDGVVVSDGDGSSVFCAPPVLTVTPGGAAAVVAPVETDTVLEDGVVVPVVVGPWLRSDGSPDVSEGGVASVDGPVDDPDGLVVPDSVVSAPATPYPVTTAAPIPRATARPPTRPIYAAALTSRVSTRRVL
jgi:hypothetical protein